jgi:hypothetical protein
VFFVARKTISKLERVILTTLFLPVQKNTNIYLARFIGLSRHDTLGHG